MFYTFKNINILMAKEQEQLETFSKEMIEELIRWSMKINSRRVEVAKNIIFDESSKYLLDYNTAYQIYEKFQWFHNPFSYQESTVSPEKTYPVYSETVFIGELAEILLKFLEESEEKKPIIEEVIINIIQQISENQKECLKKVIKLLSKNKIYLEDCEEEEDIENFQKIRGHYDILYKSLGSNFFFGTELLFRKAFFDMLSLNNTFPSLGIDDNSCDDLFKALSEDTRETMLNHINKTLEDLFDSSVEKLKEESIFAISLPIGKEKNLEIDIFADNLIRSFLSESTKFDLLTLDIRESVLKTSEIFSRKPEHTEIVQISFMAYFQIICEQIKKNINNIKTIKDISKILPDFNKEQSLEKLKEIINSLLPEDSEEQKQEDIIIFIKKTEPYLIRQIFVLMNELVASTNVCNRKNIYNKVVEFIPFFAEKKTTAEQNKVKERVKNQLKTSLIKFLAKFLQKIKRVNSTV